MVTLPQKDFEAIPEADQHKYTPHEAFAGCAKCPLFFACKGNLATRQKSKSPVLKTIPFTIGRFKEVSPDFAKAQLLCWKPGEVGLIFKYLAPETHFKTAAEMAKMMTGDDFPETFSKQELINLALRNNLRFASGMDFGFTHDFAVATAIISGPNAFIFDVISESGLELDDKILRCEKLRVWNPIIYGDPEAPADIKTFQRRGFNMRKWNKGKDSVKAGIEITRMKIKPAVGPPQMFFLKGDAGCEFAFKQLGKYHFKTGSTGEILDEPDKINDDVVDSCKYLIQNTFAPRGKIQVSATTAAEVEPRSQAQNLQYTPDNWMTKMIAERQGESVSDTGTETPGIKGKKGRFFWDI